MAILHETAGPVAAKGIREVVVVYSVTARVHPGIAGENVSAPMWPWAWLAPGNDWSLTRREGA
jgi:hypothetical protein